jgi:hypothetical protein
MRIIIVGANVKHEQRDAGHDHGKNATFGSPGKDSEVTRTIEVQASDDMRFTLGKIEVRQG